MKGVLLTEDNYKYGYYNNNEIVISHNQGFFSCCSIRLNGIVKYADEFKKYPSSVNSSDSYGWYKNEEGDITYDYFEHYGNKGVINYKNYIDFKESYQYSNFNFLNYKEIVPLVKKYFSPSEEIKNTIVNMEEKYSLDYDNICVLFYRGTDKSTEVQLSGYEKYLEYALKIYSKDNNIKFLIQSDDTKFINYISRNFKDEQLIVFRGEIRHTDKDNSVDHLDWTNNKKFSKYFLAITIIMSRCKYVICGSGNCSLWIMLFRGNSKNICQFYNGCWKSNIIGLESEYKGVYGYSLQRANGGSLGAIIYDVMKAKAYANKYNYELCFTYEGYDIPRFNGSIEDDNIPNNYWDTFFNSIRKTEEINCINIWPDLLLGCDYDYNPVNIRTYRNILQNEIFLLNDITDAKITNLVDKTPFNYNDIVIHIRRTDKLEEIDKMLTVDDYVSQIKYILEKTNLQPDTRLYICTDDKSICYDIKEKLNSKIKVVWDENETNEELHVLRNQCKLEKERAQKETLNAFKNLYIMKNCYILIGARMSYFYRIAELLRNDSCINIQDSSKFGKAEYFYFPNEKTYNIYYPKRIENFLNEDIKYENFTKFFKENNRVIVSNFLNKDTALRIKNELDVYPWWSYAIKNDECCYPVYTSPQDPSLDVHFRNCELSNLNKSFSYRFKRHIGGHYDTCVCCCCNLEETLRSFNFIRALEKITGINRLLSNEVNISYYSKGDYINVHADQDKGDIAITLSFTDEWHPSYGGNLHFLDTDLNITEVLVPSLSTLCIFRIIKRESLHFVSPVTVDKNRFVISAWYSQDTFI